MFVCLSVVSWADPDEILQGEPGGSSEGYGGGLDVTVPMEPLRSQFQRL